MEFKGLIRELLNPTREHNNFKIIDDGVMLVVEKIIHRMVVLSHNVSCVENLDTLSKNVTIFFTQIFVGSQMIAMLTTSELLNNDN